MKQFKYIHNADANGDGDILGGVPISTPDGPNVGGPLLRGVLTHGFDVDFYHLDNWVFTAKTPTEVAAIKQARIDDKAAEDAADQVVEDAYDNSGFSNLTNAQADTWIDNRLLGMSIPNDVKLELQTIFHKYNEVIVWLINRAK